MKFSPSIYLEYGADEATCEDQEFEISEHGMRFKSRWQFELHTEFRVAFSYRDELGKSRRISTLGIIVDCETLCPRSHCYRISLLFLNPHAELRDAIADVSGDLEATIGNQSTMTRRLPSV
jgi:hypothetical protein